MDEARAMSAEAELEEVRQQAKAAQETLREVNKAVKDDNPKAVSEISSGKAEKFVPRHVRQAMDLMEGGAAGAAAMDPDLAAEAMSAFEPDAVRRCRLTSG